jgi:DNA-binding response OmpR family regulator
MNKPARILLIEDESDFRAGVRIRLDSRGYEVLEAEDGKTGFELARAKSPDLIILDLMLPKMDGYQIARLLKFDAKYKTIPIIMLTARTQKTDMETGFSVGADAYLTKPFKSEELLEKIEQLLSKQAQTAG